MPGRSAKRKGTRVEREFVNNARKEGLEARRVPGSGAFEGLPGDVIIEGMRCECKARKNGWATMERWIKGNDILLLKPDRSPSMVVMWWDDWVQVVKELKDYKETASNGQDFAEQQGTGESTDRSVPSGGGGGGQESPTPDRER